MRQLKASGLVNNYWEYRELPDDVREDFLLVAEAESRLAGHQRQRGVD